MDITTCIAIAALVFSLLGSVIGYLMSGARSDVNVETLKVEAVEAKKLAAECSHKVSEIEIALAKSQTDRESLWRQVEKLEAGKVSKEVFDGLRSEITVLRSDFDKRFDRVERLIESIKKM